MDKDKKNKIFQKDIGMLFIISIGVVVVLLLIMLVSSMLGLVTPWELKEQKNEEIKKEEEKKYYDITLDKEYCKNGWIAFAKDVYYYLPKVYIYSEEGISEKLLTIDGKNIKMEENKYIYHVKDGNKYRFKQKGNLYATSDPNIIAFKSESEYDYKYDDPPYYFIDYGLFVKSSKVNEYMKYQGYDFIKKDNIAKLYFMDSSGLLLRDISETKSINDVKKSIRDISMKWDESFFDEKKYKSITLHSIDSNGLFAEYKNCLYSMEEKIVYIKKEDSDDNNIDVVCISVDLNI